MVNSRCTHSKRYINIQHCMTIYVFIMTGVGRFNPKVQCANFLQLCNANLAEEESIKYKNIMCGANNNTIQNYFTHFFC